MKTRLLFTALMTAAGLLTAAHAEGASWHESFELADPTDMFWLPNGWTAQRTPEFCNTNDPHTWCITSQLSAFYPAPLDGSFYAVAYYNDNAPQDEWLITDVHTPQEGDYLSYYVTLQPFFLYDINYFDRIGGIFTEYHMACDLQTYVSVDGGEWQMLHSLYELYKEADASEIYESAFYGYLNDRKMFADMTPYAGHEVRFAFRYVGQGGNTLFLDDIRLCIPEVKAHYSLPQSALYLGMTPDFVQPSSCLYLPDGAAHTWVNESSDEAESFLWEYAGLEDLSQTLTSTDRNLTTTYDSYLPESSQITGLENIASVPQLTATGVNGRTSTYVHPSDRMQIGGKAHITDDGKLLQTGASNCDPAKGTTIFTTSNDIPYFGISSGSKSLWSTIFGLNASQSAKITAFGSHFDAPTKEYTLRGVHIQGIGSIDPKRLFALSLSLRHRDPDYPSILAREPFASAVLDAEHITTQATDDSERMLYTLPFVFPDPITIDEEIWVTIDGLDMASSWFAPLQTQVAEDAELQSHAIFEIEYSEPGYTDRGIYYASDLTLIGADDEEMPCWYNFFVNLDMAYGDCEDWGHIEIDPIVPEMPELDYTDNTMHLASLIPEPDEDPIKFQLRCGFYNETDPERLSLYVCIGELYEYEGGPFYSDKLYDTFVIKVTMPTDSIGTPVSIDGDNVTVAYYDLLSNQWVFTADTGTICVTSAPDHVYGVEIQALDLTHYSALGARYCHTDTWRWRNYNEERPNPNQFDLKKGGRVIEHHDILSCVVDETDSELPVFYLADQPDLKSIEQVKALNASQYVIIQMPVSLMDGLMKGFSGWSDDSLTVTYKDYDYNHSGCKNDDTCYGGNVQMVTYEHDPEVIEINSTIFTMIHEDYCNLNLHYSGPFVVEGTAAIQVIEHTHSLPAINYDLFGRRATSSTGFIVNDGRVVMKR